MYTPGYIPAIDGQWDNVYSALAQFRKLESLYKEESAAEQAQDEAFYLAAKVQLYDFSPPQWTFSGICLSRKLACCRLPTM